MALIENLVHDGIPIVYWAYLDVQPGKLITVTNRHCPIFQSYNLQNWVCPTLKPLLCCVPQIVVLFGLLVVLFCYMVL